MTFWSTLVVDHLSYSQGLPMLWKHMLCNVGAAEWAMGYPKR
jgi:hypothetical protein